MKECLTCEVEFDINYGGLAAEEIKNIIANELSNYFKLQVDVQLTPKEMPLRPESIGYKRNAEHEGKKLMAGGEMDEPSPKYSFLDDPSKFSFAGV